eukprot:scaffold831_cov111-Skeletonema_marinoi.AAC.1
MESSFLEVVSSELGGAYRMVLESTELRYWMPFIRSCPPHLDQVIHIYRFVYETSTLFRSDCVAWRLARFC